MKFRVLTQNSEIYPFTLDFYDNIRSDAREKNGSQKRQPRPKDSKNKKGSDENQELQKALKRDRKPRKKDRLAAASKSPHEDGDGEREGVFVKGF